MEPGPGLQSKVSSQQQQQGGNSCVTPRWSHHHLASGDQSRDDRQLWQHNQHITSNTLQQYTLQHYTSQSTHYNITHYTHHNQHIILHITTHSTVETHSTEAHYNDRWLGVVIMQQPGVSPAQAQLPAPDWSRHSSPLH